MSQTWGKKTSQTWGKKMSQTWGKKMSQTWGKKMSQTWGKKKKPPVRSKIKIKHIIKQTNKTTILKFVSRPFALYISRFLFLLFQRTPLLPRCRLIARRTAASHVRLSAAVAPASNHARSSACNKMWCASPLRNEIRAEKKGKRRKGRRKKKENCT